ncbi:MAG: PfkB family carbohydrate kinase [Pseudorhodoplanes sp.]|uniref:PfkB family carbohydrate kinase n=1 Tax=Pseudorhodoplanes sp. TaxID=1934341 RepID=UPI003D0DB21A
MASSRDSEQGKLLVCAGMAVIDHVYRVDAFPKPGTKTSATDFRPVLGGCAANAAIAIHRLGGQARVVAPLGGPQERDPVGDNILAKLATEDIDVSAVVRVNGVSSALSSILIDKSGERLIVSYRHPGLETARPHDAKRLVSGVDAVLIDNRFPEFVLPVARAAAAIGVTVVLDGDKPTRLTDELLRIATHIVFSADGLRATAGTEELSTALTAAAQRTDAFVAVTNGPHDVIWIDEGTLRRMPAFQVDAVDTLAAGDVFHGAFALALAEGRAAADALRFAAAAAAIKCTRFGGGAGTPTRAELDQFLARASR